MQYSLFTAHRPSPSLASSQPSSLVSRLGSTEDLYCDDELRSLATSDPVNMRLLDPGLAIQPGDSAWPGTEPGDDGGLGSSASIKVYPKVRNHGEGPYKGLLLVESGYYRFHI